MSKNSISIMLSHWDVGVFFTAATTLLPHIYWNSIRNHLFWKKGHCTNVWSLKTPHIGKLRFSPFCNSTLLFWIQLHNFTCIPVKFHLSRLSWSLNILNIHLEFDFSNRCINYFLQFPGICKFNQAFYLWSINKNNWKVGLGLTFPEIFS